MPDLTQENLAAAMAALDEGIGKAADFANADPETLNFSPTLPANKDSDDFVPPEVLANNDGTRDTNNHADDEGEGDPAAATTTTEGEGDGAQPAAAKPAKPAAKAAPAQPDAPKPPADGAADPAAGEVDPATGKPKAPAAAPPPEAGTPEADAALAATLKGRSKERFEQLSGEVREFAPLREGLAKAGIKTVDDLAGIQQRAQDGEDLIGFISSTGVSTEDFNTTLNYLTLVNQANATGSPETAGEALKILLPAVLHLSALAGIDPATAVGDPLDAYPQLKQQVEDGDLSRENALKQISGNTSVAINQRNTAARNEQVTAQAEEERAKAWLQNYDAQMLANDPDYEAKRPMLSSLVRTIRKTLPPSAWEQATKDAYASIPAVPKPAPPPKQLDNGGRTLPRMGATRPGSHTPAMAPQTDDPMEALNYGLDLARR